MLETMEERVKLLKAGFDGKSIEKLYLKYNNIKILGGLQHELNCCEFKRCCRKPGGNKVDDGLFAKTLPSCMTCTFFKIVIAEGCFDII